MQPGLGQALFTANRADRDVERPGRFVDAEAGEVAEFDDAALAFVDRGEPGKRVVERAHVVALGGRKREDLLERYWRHPAAALLAAMSPRMIDQNLPHQVRGDAIEMC